MNGCAGGGGGSGSATGSMGSGGGGSFRGAAGQQAPKTWSANGEAPTSMPPPISLAAIEDGTEPDIDAEVPFSFSCILLLSFLLCGSTCCASLLSPRWWTPALAPPSSRSGFVL